MRGTTRAGSSILSLLLACTAACAENVAIIVGVGRSMSTGLLPLFGDKDGDSVRNALQAFQIVNPRLIRAAIGPGTSRGAKPPTEVEAREALRTGLTGALPSQTVYVFISARGQLTVDRGFGTLHTLDSFIEKKGEVSVEDLQMWLNQSEARSAILFIDVYRERKIEGRDNRIQSRLLALHRNKGSLILLLASEPGEPSEEGAKFGGGHGLFAYTVRNHLPQIATTPAETFFRMLRDRVLAESERRQRLRWKPENQQQPILARTAATTRFAFMHLVAWNLLPAQMPAQVALADRTEALCKLLREYVASGRISDEDAIRAIDEANAGGIAGPARDDLAIELESIGQPVVSRYGIGDQFAGDPWIASQQDFERAYRAYLCAWRLKRQAPDKEWVLERRLQARMLFCKGRALLMDGNRRDQARAPLLQATQLQEPVPEPHNALGVYHLERGEFKEAVVAFRQAIHLAPLWAYPRHNLALTYIEMGDRVRAVEEYRKALERTPNYPYLHYNAGLAEQRLGRRNQAVRSYDAAIKTFTSEAVRYDDLAKLWTTDDPAFAAKATTRAQSLRKARAQVKNALCALHETRSKAADNSKCYQEALGYDPELHAARHNLALLLRAGGNPKGAIEHWRKILAAEPEEESARLDLAATLQQEGDAGLARAEYDRILGKHPQHYQAKAGVARAWASDRNWNEAIRWMKWAIADQVAACGAKNCAPLASSDYYLELANSLYEAGLQEESCQNLRQAHASRRRSGTAAGKAAWDRMNQRCRVP